MSKSNGKRTFEKIHLLRKLLIQGKHFIIYCFIDSPKIDLVPKWAIFFPNLIFNIFYKSLKKVNKFSKCHSFFILLNYLNMT